MKKLAFPLLLALVAAGPAAADMHTEDDLMVEGLDEADGMATSMVDPADVDPELMLPGPVERYGKTRATSGSNRWESKGDLHMKSAHYRSAAEAYKLALKYAPDSEKIWEKHRQAFQMDRAIEGYVAKAEALLDDGLHEEAASFLKLAVRLDPRNQILWRLYERALAENPHVVVVTTEQEAWDAYRRGREVLDGGRYGAAIRYFEPVLAYTGDERLKFYAEQHLAKAEEMLRKDYPNLPRRITDR